VRLDGVVAEEQVRGDLRVSHAMWNAATMSRMMRGAQLIYLAADSGRYLTGEARRVDAGWNTK
jgi:hypothetical protein